MGQPIDFSKQKVVVSCFHKKSLALKYLNSGKEDPQARTVGSLVVHRRSFTTFNAFSQIHLQVPESFVFWVTWD